MWENKHGGLLFLIIVHESMCRSETTYQIALAIKDEVEDLEKAGITVIQIDEAALREGLPLRKSEQADYLDWAVHSFRITNVGVQDTTQVLWDHPKSLPYYYYYFFILCNNELFFVLDRSTLTCATPTSTTSSTPSLTWMPMLSPLRTLGLMRSCSQCSVKV